MARIPVIDPKSQLQAAPTGAYGQAQAYRSGGGQAALASGLQDLSQGLQSVGRLMEKRKMDKESGWITDSLMQYDRVLTDFYSLEDNQQREDFAQAFEKSANDELGKYLKSAPSEGAALEFKRKAMDRAATYYKGALNQSEKTRIGNLQLGIDGQMNNLLASWRNNARNLPPAESRKLMESGFQDIMEHVDQTFGNLPNTSRRMRETLTMNYILAASEHNPAMAQELLEKTELFDEETRQQIGNRIKMKTENNMAIEKAALDQRVASEFQLAEARLAPVRDIPLADFQAAYSNPEMAVVQKAKFDRDRKTSDIATSFLSNVAPQSISIQESTYANMHRKAVESGDVETLDALKAIRPRLDKIQIQQQADPVGFLDAYNPMIQDVNQKILTAPPEEKASLMQVKRQMAIQLQGMPSPETPEHMKGQFLGKAQADWNILSLSEANAWTKRLNETRDLTQIPAMVNEFIATYGEGIDPGNGARMARMAFNDLVSLPEAGNRIDPAYQVGFMMWDSPYIGHFWAAMGAFRDNKGIAADREADYRTAIASEAPWTEFRQYLTTSPQGASDASSFMTGLTAFAMSLDPQNASEGARKAMDIVFKDRLGFMNVNGQKMMIDLRKDDGGIRGEDEISVMETGLGSLVDSLKKEDMALTDPLWGGVLPAGFEATSPALQDSLFKSLIQSQSFMRSTADGRGANLYLVGDHGIPFEARKKDGTPFLVLFDKYQDVTLDLPGLDTGSPNSASARRRVGGRKYSWE